MDNRIDAFHTECLIRGFSTGYSRDIRLEVGALARWLSCGLEDADTDTLKRYIVYLITTPARNKPTPRSGATVYRIVSRLKAFYRWLEETDQIPDNPMKLIRGPRHRDKLIEPLTRIEMARVMAGARTGRSPILANRNYAIVMLALDTGLRLSEILQLNRDQADGETLTVVGKGGKSRTVALNPVPRSAIGEMLAAPARRRAMGAAGAADIPARFAWPVTARNTVRVYRRVLAGELIGTRGGGG